MKSKKKSQLSKLIVGGIAATAAITLICYALSAMIGLHIDIAGTITNHIANGLPGTDISNSLGLGNAFGTGKHYIVGSLVSQYIAQHKSLGTLIYIIVGAIVLPFIYGLLVGYIPKKYTWLKKPWLKGICYGLILWVILEAVIIQVIFPVMGYGFLIPQIANAKALFVALIGYIGYGATLGAIAGDKVSLRKK